jgi:hypothetical protein
LKTIFLIHLFPRPVFFEIEIDEVQKDGQKHYALQNIVPVLAERTPDWCILKFRIKRGNWTITERIHTATPEWRKPVALY